MVSSKEHTNFPTERQLSVGTVYTVHISRVCWQQVGTAQDVPLNVKDD